MYGEYDVVLGSPAVIVDAGSNIGLAAIDFALQCPNARILAVEPDPFALAKLRRNTQVFPQITVIPSALAATAGSRVFYSGIDSWTSAFTRTDGKQSSIRVRTTTLDEILRGAGVVKPLDVLKLDVEGAEGEILRTFAGLSSTLLILGEVHGPPSSAEAEAILQMVRDAGFQVTVTHRSAQTQTFTAITFPMAERAS